MRAVWIVLFPFNYNHELQIIVITSLSILSSYLTNTKIVSSVFAADYYRLCTIQEKLSKLHMFPFRVCILKKMNKLFVLAVLCFSLTAVVLMKTALQRFHEVRKYFRLQEYASEVKDIADSLNTLEKNSLTLKNDVQALKRIAKHALQYFNASEPPQTQSVNGLK